MSKDLSPVGTVMCDDEVSSGLKPGRNAVAVVMGMLDYAQTDGRTQPGGTASEGEAWTTD